MDRKKLFNPEGDDTLNARRIIKGNSTNLFNLNNVRYQWANQLYRTMMANFWIPEKVDLTQIDRLIALVEELDNEIKTIK